MGEDREFIIHVFYWCTPLCHEIYIKCKKKSNLIKGISSHNIYCGIKSQQVKEIFCHSVLKNFDFSQNSSFPFHWVTFYHSISCVLLVDKANKSCQNSKKKKKKKKRKKYHIHHKKTSKKKRKKYYTSKDKCPNFPNFFRRPKMINSNLSNEK